MSKSRIATQLAALSAAVATQTTVTASAIALITGLSEQIKQATATLADTGADTSELVEITNQITTQSEALANAVLANTISEAEPVTSEAPAPALASEETNDDQVQFEEQTVTE